MRIFIRLLSLLSFGFIVFFFATKDYKNPVKNSCISCHTDYGSLSSSHSLEIMGCDTCHGGQYAQSSKKAAHQGLVKNPAYLQNAQLYCSSCHLEQINKVSLSLMQSEEPIKRVLEHEWLKGVNEDVNASLMKNLAKSHFDKACASCHINQDESVFHNAGLAKGGGCSDCHRVEKSAHKHPKYSKQIPAKNCLKCHNRSARIGLAYFGYFESETHPLEEAKNYTELKNWELERASLNSSFVSFKTLNSSLSNSAAVCKSWDLFSNSSFSDPAAVFKTLNSSLSNSAAVCKSWDLFSNSSFNTLNSSPKPSMPWLRLADGRYFYKIQADVHAKAGMSCIDCHEQVMGDGKSHKYMQDAVRVSCLDCHAFKPKKALKNLSFEKDKAYIKRKLDGKRLLIPKLSLKSYHSGKDHKRLACNACHAKWMPSCYGCHEQYFPKYEQYDWVRGKNTKGAWSELRSFLRFEEPALGVNEAGFISVFAPGCQIIATIYGKKLKRFHAMSMASWDPHTTTKTPRACINCHFSSKALGLGGGILNIKNPAPKGQKAQSLDFNGFVLAKINPALKYASSQDSFKIGPGFKNGAKAKQTRAGIQGSSQATQTVANLKANQTRAGFKNESFKSQKSLAFTPFYVSKANKLPFSYPIDAFVSVKGLQYQNIAEPKARAFRLEEIRKITKAYACIICHDSYEDAIYRDFKASKARQEGSKCKV